MTAEELDLVPTSELICALQRRSESSVVLMAFRKMKAREEMAITPHGSRLTCIGMADMAVQMFRAEIVLGRAGGG